jgi:hypothetical protein
LDGKLPFHNLIPFSLLVMCSHLGGLSLTKVFAGDATVGIGRPPIQAAEHSTTSGKSQLSVRFYNSQKNAAGIASSRVCSGSSLLAYLPD